MRLTNHSFNSGDMVRVCNPALKTYCKVGRVLSTYYSTVEVQIDDLPVLKYKSCNLELVSRGAESDYVTHDVKITNETYEKTKETNDMAVTGNYEVAMVRFVQGMNTTKEYAFALFDPNVAIDDTVLVDTANGYGVAVVCNTHTKDDYEQLGCALPTREVICKIDFTAFDERKAKRAKAAKLKTDMDKMVKSLQEIAVFELLAEKSPELKAMLEEYKSVIG